MHEARERKEDRRRHPQQHVRAEYERHALHQRNVGRERKERAEPRRNRRAIVKSEATQGVRQRPRAARQDGEEEHEVEPAIHARRVDLHVVLAQKTALQEQQEAEEKQDARRYAARQRDDVIEMLVDSRRFRADLWDEHADDVPAQGHEEAEVEHRTGDLQIILREKFARFRRPAALHQDVARYRAAYEHGESDVGQYAPKELIHAASPSHLSACMSTTSKRKA